MRRKIDCHTHLAGVGTQGSGCWTSPKLSKRLAFRILRRMHGVTPEQLERSFDQDWAARLASTVRASEIDHAVALGFDGVYDARGEFDERLSQMIVPPSFVFDVCRRHPELLPGPSINPHRRDALELLEMCIEEGAVLIKWLPATQRIDPSDAAIEPFYARLADARIPILIHSGGSENTFAQVDARLKDLRLIQRPLRMGVPFIIAHTAAPVTYARDENQVPLLRRWLAEFPHLWVDNSGISNLSRFPHLPKFATDAELAARTLHGSDWPVPTNSFYYVRQLGRPRVMSLEREKNPLQRDVAIKRALGYPGEVLTRACDVLPNLARWIDRAPTSG
jgi:hypothetical protein